jgi:hypothetical protein
MANQKPEFGRAQFLLASMLNEILAALDNFHKTRPQIIPSSLQNFAFNGGAWVIARGNFVTVIDSIARRRGVNFQRLQDVGLTGPMLEWKADLLYLIVGRTKPAETKMPKVFPIASQTAPLTYPPKKPWFRRLWKYAKSLFDSLIEAIERDSKLRAILDAIKEYIDCVEASVKFVEDGAPAEE